MTKITLSQPIQDLDGHVTTGAQLLDAGKAFVEAWEYESRRSKSGKTTKYFLHLVDRSGKTAGSFDIGEKAYQSRAAKGQNVPPEPEQKRRKEISGDPIIFRYQDVTIYGSWDGETWVALVGYDIMVAMKRRFNVVHVQSTNQVGDHYSVHYLDKPVPHD